MSVTGGTAAAGSPPSWPRWVWANAAWLGRRLRCAPRTAAKPRWPSYGIIGACAVTALVVIAGLMVFVDAWAIELARRLPRWVFVPFDELTDFGKSGWFLIPAGFGLALIAAVASPALPRFTRLVIATLAVRLTFLFTAIAVPSLFATVIKRLIGRARPVVGGQADPFQYLPLVWRSEYASLPSGHATTAFAALIAGGLIWPRLRAIAWAYALIIAASRVVVLAHYPSDVVAGALAGAVGAWLVRDWFAVRRLGFVVDADGHIRTLPGPSVARIKRVARRLLGP
jgi:membrane-associated phospholipid phosphatase